MTTPGARALWPPMAFDWYHNINDADMSAMIAYLRSLAPQGATGRAQGGMR